MKTFGLGCKSIQDGILVSLVFLCAALVMMLTARYLVPEIPYFRGAVTVAGLVLLLLSPAILVGTWLRTRTHGGDPRRR
jgi:hypothetical protein